VESAVLSFSNNLMRSHGSDSGFAAALLEFAIAMAPDYCNTIFRTAGAKRRPIFKVMIPSGSCLCSGHQRRRQVKIEDMAKFHTDPTTAPAAPANHHAWCEVNAYEATPTLATAPTPQIR
jgi:hypothetical protein